MYSHEGIWDNAVVRVGQLRTGDKDQDPWIQRRNLAGRPDPGYAGPPRLSPTRCGGLLTTRTGARGEAGTVTRTMSVIAVLAFALLVLGCSGPQEQERAGGAHGEDAARPAQEAKSSGRGTDIPPLPSDSATGPATAAGAPSPPSANEALSMLEELAIASPSSMAGYSREEYPHWASDADAYGWQEPDGSCDVRDVALIRDGKGVQIDEDCDITAGTWLDPYTGRALSDPSEVDIDHVVPLANAWRSGASSAVWSTADREAYANDPEVLLSSEAGANRTKGDNGPEAWKPPNRDYWCEYARRWIWIKSDWRLTVNPAEKSALRGMLGTCAAG
jgi:hypothetical protein